MWSDKHNSLAYWLNNIKGFQLVFFFFSSVCVCVCVLTSEKTYYVDQTIEMLFRFIENL